MHLNNVMIMIISFQVRMKVLYRHNEAWKTVSMVSTFQFQAGMFGNSTLFLMEATFTVINTMSPK